MPNISLQDWLLILETYAVACENDRLVIHPRSVIRWVEAVKDDHDIDD